MITVTKQDNGVLFTFENSDKYLYGSGTIEVPFNSLSIIQDESNMITLRKSASNDIFLAARYDTDLGYSSKEEAVEALKGMLFAETGGSSGSGVTPSEVQEMIDAATSGIPSSEVVEALRNDLNTVSGDVENKQDALEYYSEAEYPAGGGRGMINVYNGKTYHSSVEANVGTTDGGTYASLYAQGEAGSNALKVSTSGVTINNAKVLTENDINPNDLWDTIDEKEEVIASALTQLNQDVSAIDAKEEVIASALTEVRQNVDTLSGDVQTKVAISDFNAYSAATATAIGNKQNALQIYSENEYDEETGEEATAQIQVIGQGDSSGDGAGVYVQPYTIALSAYSEGEDPMTTTLVVTSDDVTINEERVLTESDGVYYIDFGVLTTQGIHDADWDGLVNAINAHRPIYAVLGGEYYVSECLAQSGNQIILTASNHLAHFIYTFTKNDSENYSFDYGTKPYVTDAEKATWNAKQDALSAGTGIEISGNVISATGGGGSYVYYTEDTSSESVTIKVQNDDGAGNLTENRVFVGGGDIIIENYNETDDGEGNTGTTDTQFNIDSLRLSIIAYSDDGINTTETELKVQPMGAYINSEPIATEPYVDAATSGKVDTSAITTSITSGSTDSEIPTAKAVYDTLGGLKLVKLTQSEYDQLATKDPDTLYIITNVVS